MRCSQPPRQKSFAAPWRSSRWPRRWQRRSPGWIVVECNDGQESGHAGIAPIGLWQAVVAAERRRGG
jgi:hypothetical protein